MSMKQLLLIIIQLNKFLAMELFEVSKRTLNVLNIIFMSILVSGLLWQVTKISINYFRFDVVSSIRILLPGIEEPKAMNVCFDAYSVRNRTRMTLFMETFNKTRIRRPISKQDIDRGGFEYVAFEYLSRRELFDLTLTSEELFPDNDHSNGIMTGRMRYGLYLQICYQLVSSTDATTVARNLYPVGERLSSRKELKKLEVSTYAAINIIGMKPPTTMMLSDISQVPPIRSLIGRTQTRSYRHISSYFYDINKLSKPYTDQCIKYGELEFRDRFDTIQSCIENSTVNNYGKISRTRIFTTLNDNEQFMFPDSNTTGLCHRLIHYDDCHRQTHIPKYHIYFGMWNPDSGVDTFYRLFSDESSYVIVSQPKIEHIDYVTYVFGAMGTWFGFSFLMVNPFGYFFVVSKVSTDQKADHDLELDNQINQISSELIDQLKSAQQSIKHTMDRVINLEKQINHDLDSVPESP